MPNQQISIRSEEVQEILTAVPNWMISWGNTLLFLLIITFFGISWMIKYPDVISADAMITSPNPPQKIFAERSGVIKNILVKNQQSIFNGQILAIIENTSDYRDVLLLSEILDSVSLRKEEFYFPIDQIPLLDLGDLAIDYSLFENSYEQFLLHQQLRPFSAQAKSYENSISALQKRLQDLEFQKKLNEEELELKTQELKRSKTLSEEGLISLQSYENKQLDWLQASRNLKNIDLSISQTKESIGESNISSQRNQIDQTQEEKKLFRSLIQSLRQLKVALKNWELMYVIKSNIDGNITFLNLQSENQKINPGDLLFSIIPGQQNNYFAQLKTSANNSGKIKKGQTVNIKVLNYPDSEFGQLQGKVESISPMTDHEGYYLVKVHLPLGLRTNYHKEIQFSQEMQGNAEIITDDLRLAERWFQQIRSIWQD